MAFLNRFLAALAIFCLFTAPASISGAEKKPLLMGGTPRKGADQPLRITSEKLEADNKNQLITFTGKVVAKQGDMTIYADVAQVYYEKKDEGNDVREIVATGNVKIHEGERVATGQKAVFLNGEQKIILTGQPKVWQGKDMVSGDRIVVLLEDDKSFVESGPDRRVEVILYPKEGGFGKAKP
ncbi:MAG TPA: lipopolysaccharide transport periplasmic protein LptA [Thermodesulfobacteriota bacterium]|nr:lipopolysaccharide transport periplasmic protein LptA [Thermodesulfobacteriota bacterium]